jgi:membrane fusion protein, multidrug efflux system
MTIVLNPRNAASLIVFAVTASLTLLLAACGSGGAPQTQAAAALPAKVIEAAPQSVPIVIEAVGQVEGSKEVEVRARVSGILKRRLYQEGEVVAAGEPLFQIDPEPFENALSQARSQLAQEAARNEQARREAARLKDLVAQRAISQKEFDDAQSNAKLLDATVKAAEARVRDAELNLSYTNVDAPVAGVSGRAARSEGSLISTGADSLLTTISQADPVWVRFSMSESDLAKLPGGRLTRSTNPEIRVIFPDGSLFAAKGRLNFAASQIDPKLATLQLRAEFTNAKDQLLPGQFVRVQIVAGKRDNVFLVPQVAVTQTETGYLLFVLDKEGKAALRPVKVGEWVGKDWIILEGLNKGDKVVVDNLLKLRPGMSVTAPAEAGAAPNAAAPAGNAPPTNKPAK